jgi:fructosamine-3-kinase
VSDALAAAAGEVLGCAVARAAPIAGGDLNDAYRLELADGRRVFVKTADDAAPGAFACEAASLRWLADAGALPVPDVLGVADDAGRPRFLALAWVDEGPRAPGFSEALGRGLARLHAAGAPAFGATGAGTPGGGATVLGPLTLPNEPRATWAEFYGACRLEPVARIADERHALPAGTLATLDRLLGRLPDLLGPPEPPARLHGDLWSGNLHAGPDGAPWLIDPAAYGGHREVDLAMLALFGAPDARFLSAYEEVAPLADGHQDRVALHQLFPLLVHATLFGGGYGASAARIVERYA